MTNYIKLLGYLRNDKNSYLSSNYLVLDIYKSILSYIEKYVENIELVKKDGMNLQYIEDQTEELCLVALDNVINNSKNSKKRYCSLVYISQELNTFIGKNNISTTTKSEIIKLINEYICKNKLKGKIFTDENGNKQKNMTYINPDEKLTKLFNNNENGEITFFNLEKYIDPHLIDCVNVDNVFSFIKIKTDKIKSYALKKRINIAQN